MNTNSLETKPSQKFNIGDEITWKGGPATVIAVNAETPWPHYTLQCDNGQHTLEFADQSFCDLVKAAALTPEARNPSHADVGIAGEGNLSESGDDDRTLAEILASDEASNPEANK